MRRLLLMMIVMLFLGAVVVDVNAGILQQGRGEMPAFPAINPDDLAKAGEECTGDNLISNPSFEGPNDYTAYIPPNGHPDCPAGICTSVLTAPNWSPWWQQSNNDQGGVRGNPEYKASIITDIGAEGTQGGRVLSGEAAQQYFSFFRTHRAGFYQQISGLTPGVTYRFCLWGHAWSAGQWQDPGTNSIPDMDFISGPEFGHLDQKIGIDPTGGTAWPTDGVGTNIIWNSPRTQYDQWGLFTIEATATSETVTVYAFSEVQFSVRNNDVYWDDASLVAVSDEERQHIYLPTLITP